MSNSETLLRNRQVCRPPTLIFVVLLLVIRLFILSYLSALLFFVFLLVHIVTWEDTPPRVLVFQPPDIEK